MKKRFLKILAAALLICMFTVQSVYAADLTIESIYPADGENGVQTTNQMARIVFSGNIDIKTNEGYFKILDSKGEEQEILVLEQPDIPNRVNLVLVNDLSDSSEYTIVIDGAVTDTEGNTLGADSKTVFKTKSLKTDSIVTTVMMVVMMAAIVVFTFRDQAKKAREAEEAAVKSGKKKPEKVNPYKDAKKEAEKVYAQKQKEKEMKVREQMRKNEAKAKAKAKKKK